MNEWMALIRENGNKRSDWDIVAQKVTRDQAVEAAIDRLKFLGIDYVMGSTFSDGTQQICYADGYDGSPILGKIVPQSDDPDVIHSFSGLY